MFKQFKLYHAVILCILALCILLIGSYILIIKQPEYGYERIIINIEDTEFNAYSSGNSFKGSTVNTIKGNGENGFNCVIRHVEQYPFCVLTIDISNASTDGIDFSIYKEMIVHGTFSSPNEDFLRIGFRHFDPSYSSIGSTNSMKFNQLELKSDNLGTAFSVNFNNLIVPAWWVAGLKKENVNDIIELTNITHIELATGTLPSKGTYRLRVDYFELEREIISISKVYEYLLVTWASIIIFLMLTILLILSIRLKIKSKNEKILLEINNALALKSSELEIISQTDGLTGALNRIGLQKKLINTVKQRHYPSVVTLVDIDHFKAVNDEFGHQKGDFVLENICKTINKNLLDGESLSRFGGEEFLILMPNLSIDEVKERINFIRLDIESSEMNIGRSVTASFGVAQINKNDNVKKVIAQADEALYKAKDHGRNCIRYDG